MKVQELLRNYAHPHVTIEIMWADGNYCGHNFDVKSARMLYGKNHIKEWYVDLIPKSYYDVQPKIVIVLRHLYEENYINEEY